MKTMNIIETTELPSWFLEELATATEDLKRAEHWEGLGESRTADAIRRTAHQKTGIAGIQLASGDPELLGKALLSRLSPRPGGGRLP